MTRGLIKPDGAKRGTDEQELRDMMDGLSIDAAEDRREREAMRAAEARGKPLANPLPLFIGYDIRERAILKRLRVQHPEDTLRILAGRFRVETGRIIAERTIRRILEEDRPKEARIIPVTNARPPDRPEMFSLMNAKEFVDIAMESLDDDRRADLIRWVVTRWDAKTGKLR